MNQKIEVGVPRKEGGRLSHWRNVWTSSHDGGMQEFIHYAHGLKSLLAHQNPMVMGSFQLRIRCSRGAHEDSTWCRKGQGELLNE